MLSNISRFDKNVYKKKKYLNKIRLNSFRKGKKLINIKSYKNFN